MQPLRCLFPPLGVLWLSLAVTQAIDLNPSDPGSIKKAASTIAYGMVKYYKGNETGQTPGLLPNGYYWWEAGGMFMSLIDYWYYTGDSQYNDLTKQAMVFQVGPDKDYMPPNQTKDEGNDDQAFWGMAAMSAAECKFPDPPEGQPQWLALAQGVFNSQAARWDNVCGGGLRWQIVSYEDGYRYKNSIANGGLFNIASRLAVYTGNSSYADWADKIWNWEESKGLIGKGGEVYDGTNIDDGCKEINHNVWTYNYGIYLLGAAYMFNFTKGSATWEGRVNSLINGSSVFFQDGVMSEILCEARGNCNTDRQSFKSYTTRWMAATTKLAPFATKQLMAQVNSSAVAAAQQCSGGYDGVTCGLRWTLRENWDKSYGVGQQMNALQVIQGLLIDQAPDPVTADKGGTSKGNPEAGTGSHDNSDEPHIHPIMTADRAGAWILTVLVALSVVAVSWFMVV